MIKYFYNVNIPDTTVNKSNIIMHDIVKGLHVLSVFIIFPLSYLFGSLYLSVSINLSLQQKVCRLTEFQPIEVYSTVSGKAVTDRALLHSDWVVR